MLRHWGVLTIFTSQCARACTFWTSQLSKVAQDPQFLRILTSKCASTWCVLYILTSTFAWCRSGMHFFDISPSKNSPRLKCFDRFYFQVCFKHLRATMACNFWSLIWPAVSAPAPLESLLLEPPDLSSDCFFLWLLSPLLLHLSISWKFDF